MKRITKIILIFVALILILFAASKIKLVHKDMLPLEERLEIYQKDYYKELLIGNNIRSKH